VDRTCLRQELPRLIKAALHCVETGDGTNHRRLERFLSARTLEEGLRARQGLGDRGRAPEEARRKGSERVRLEAPVAGSACVLGYAFECEPEVFPVTAQVFANGHEVPGRGEGALVPGRLELAHALSPELDCLFRRQRELRRRPQESELADGPQLQ
jgi:hypothetical protein